VPGDNFSRRVARAAAAGGGRTYRAQTPVTWYLVVLVICLLGVSLVAFSRYELLHPLPAAAAKQTPPTATNEWEAAVAVDVCGKFVPSLLPAEPIPDEPVASLGNGVIRIDPGVSPQAAEFEGAHATLGAYLGLESAEITPTLASFPGVPVPTTTTSTTSTSTTTTTTAKTSTTKGPAKSTTSSSSSTTTTTTLAPKPRNYKNGQKCEGKPASTVVETWPTPTSTKGQIVSASKASGIRFKDGQLITIAFVPKGTTIPRPPAAARNIVSTFLVEDPTGFATTTIPSTVATTSTSATTTTTLAGKGSTASTTTSSSSP
jgi:hypothetical protein